MPVLFAAVLASRPGWASSLRGEVHACQSTAHSDSPSGVSGPSPPGQVLTAPTIEQVMSGPL